MAKNFSDKYLASLKPRGTVYQVREAKGFALRVLPTGCKTFLFIYEKEGKRKQLNLGNYPLTSLSDARKKYNDAVEALSQGEPLVKTVDPTPSQILSVKELVDLYLIDAKKDNCAAWAEIKESAYKNKLKSWHARSIESITKMDALRLIDQERLLGDGAMRNLHKITCALFQYAEDRDYIPKNPFRGLKKIKPSLKNKERTRFLTEAEVKTVWNGITAGGGVEVTKRALKLILVTAQRPGEVAGMHRREISGDWWTIPSERAEKGGRDHRVFLTGTAKELIGDAEGYIFPTPKKAAGGFLSDVTLAMRVREEGCYGLPHWTPHDLRRTARTHMSRLRVPREHAEAVLNHAKQGMVKVYDQYEFDAEKREALQAWETELLRLVAQSTSSE